MKHPDAGRYRRDELKYVPAICVVLIAPHSYIAFVKLNGPHVGCDLLFNLHVDWGSVGCVVLVALAFCNVIPSTGFVIFLPHQQR